MDTDRLARWFEIFADVECPDLPLYRTLCHGFAADPETLRLLLDAAPGQWRPNLLLAALHDLVLRFPDEPFARLYPTVGGSFAEGTDPLPLARDFLDAHRDEVERLIATRSTQTNEVNRSCLWFAATRLVAAELPDRPVAFVEIGASAGLNLAFDRYAYDVGDGRVRGDASSTVRLRCRLDGTPLPLDAPLDIVHRIGLDRSPVDLADPDERRWLKACIWPEQPERHANFDAAADLAVADPPTLVADDAVDGVAELIEGCPDDAHIVVVNSWVMTYLSRERRRAFDAAVDLLGDDRPLTRISAEGEGVVEWVPLDDDGPEPQTVVGIRRYRDGNRSEERAAVCHPHLQWLRWDRYPISVP